MATPRKPVLRWVSAIWWLAGGGACSACCDVATPVKWEQIIMTSYGNTRPCWVNFPVHYFTTKPVQPCYICVIINTLRSRQNGRRFADIFKCIFLNENLWILIKISLSFVSKGSINNIPALVQIMAWRRPAIAWTRVKFTDAYMRHSASMS